MQTNNIFVHKEAGEYLGLPKDRSGKHYCRPLFGIKAIEMTEIIARVETRMSIIIDEQNKIILQQKDLISKLQSELQEKTIGNLVNPHGNTTRNP